MTRSSPTLTIWTVAAIAVGLLTAGTSCGDGTARQATPATPATARPTQAAEPGGAIEGKLSFPALNNPRLTVYAIRVGPGSPPWYRLNAAKRQVSYVLSPVAAGTYTLFAYEADPQYGAPPRVGGYTAAVVCGLSPSCADHTPVQVTVQPGETKTGIDISDYRAPAGTFPPEPSAR